MLATNYHKAVSSDTTPRFDHVIVGDRKIEVCCFLIEGEDYRICDEFSHARWSNKKKGVWGSGMVNSREDPRKVERTGLLGEMATGMAFDLPIDLTYREGGDSEDFMLFGKTVNVKMRTEAPPRHDRGLIKCRHNANSSYMPLKHDLYLFGFLDWEHEGKAEVCLVGGRWREDIDLTEHSGFRGEHINHEVHYRHMIPIRQLIKDHNDSLVHSG